MSASTKPNRPLSKMQFWAVLTSMAMAVVLAVVVLLSVAGKHGKCPSETQVSRPGASVCWAAYRNSHDPTLVGHQAATS